MGIREMELGFINVEDVQNICELKDIRSNPNKLLKIFLTHEWDILYIFAEGDLYAIASVGDIFKWHERGMDEFTINTNFSYVSQVDYADAKIIFEKIKTIYEVPVVIQGKMIGVIRKSEKHTEEEWRHIHKKIENIEFDWKMKKRTRFLIDEIRRWKEQNSGIELYLYANPGEEMRNYLSDDEKKEYIQKIEYLGLKRNKMEYASEHGFNMNFMDLKGIQYKGCFYFEEYKSDGLNIKNRHRITSNAEKQQNKIFFLGPCTFFGTYVKDTETIEYYIQEEINKRKLPYEVVNCAFPGPEYIEQNLFVEGMKKGDKVVLSFRATDESIELVNRCMPGIYKGNLTEVYSKIEDPVHSCFDAASHCNGRVNKKIAERIWKDISVDCEQVLKEEKSVYDERKSLQDYYIPYEIHNYFDEYIDEYSLCKNEECRIGAIVMNCNPFTLGHKALIEKAAESVDGLYIFVVEEDKSYYPFKDRFEMVKRGVAGLANVKVLPSGKYILSKETFAQYFEKEFITEVEDMSWDIRIFGGVIAKKLGITKRFVGEEPNDIVTREYNETMKEILPEYGIEVIEIPRIRTSEGTEIISATSVRKLIKDNDYDSARRYCPDSTIDYLINR